MDSIVARSALGPARVFHGPLPVLGDLPEVLCAVLGRHLGLVFFQRPGDRSLNLASALGPGSGLATASAWGSTSASRAVTGFGPGSAAAPGKSDLRVR